MTVNQTYRQLKILGTVNNTIYLFQKDSKVLLPIKLNNQLLKMPKSFWYFPDIYNTTKRIILSLNVAIVGIKIYQEEKEMFFSYLSLQNSSDSYEINVSLEDALLIKEDSEIPIYATEAVLQKCGIPVTKDLIQKAIDLNIE